MVYGGQNNMKIKDFVVIQIAVVAVVVALIAGKFSYQPYAVEQGLVPVNEIDTFEERIIHTMKEVFFNGKREKSAEITDKQ